MDKTTTQSEAVTKKLEEFRTKLAKVNAETAEKVTIARLDTKLNLLNSPVLAKARVNSAITAVTSDRLKELDASCNVIVQEMPITSAKTREARKWNPSRQFGYGNHMAMITGILSGIQYSTTEHKTQMLAITGLNEDTIEATLEAFGSQSFYSKNHNMVIPEQPFNMEALLGNLGLIEEALDISLDISKVTESVMASRFAVALVTADRNLAQAELTAQEQAKTITV